MLSEFQSNLIKTVEMEPGIGPGAAADLAGQDKSYTRREMRKLASRGHFIEQVNGNGYAYYSVGASQTTESVLEVKPDQEPPIDGVFREIQAPPSSSRALVPVHGAAAAYDSRTAQALKQHAAARSRHKSQGGHAVSGQFATTLNSLYQFDPIEVERAELDAERVRIDEERRQLARDREVSRVLVAVPSQPPLPTWADLFLGACAIGMGAVNAHQSLVRQKIEARAEKQAEQRPVSIGQHVGFVEEDKPSEPTHQDDADQIDDTDDYEELEDIYNRQFEREAQNDAYGETETIVDEESGRKFVKPKIPSLLPDMAKLQKEKWRKEAQSAVVVPARRVDVMRKFAAAKRPVSEQEPEPPKQGWVHWLFAGPSKSEWR
jgi:hypothetical protein